MKKLFDVLVLTLALNFLAIAGAAGWLRQTGRLDRERIIAIRDILFPNPLEVQPTTQPAADPTTQPLIGLDELLAKTTARTATEQVQLIQHAFDTQMVQLERRQRELNDLQRQVDLAKQQLTRDRESLEAQRSALSMREEEATRLASDKGFQDSLELYKSMPAKQVKSIFMTLDDATVVSYLQAMEPRTATRIIKEFKSPDEMNRIQKIMEMMRQTFARTQAKE